MLIDIFVHFYVLFAAEQGIQRLKRLKYRTIREQARFKRLFFRKPGWYYTSLAYVYYNYLLRYQMHEKNLCRAPKEK